MRPDVTLVGQTVGRIRVQELLGRGGMGEVYIGFDETLQRQVALKAMRARHRLGAEHRARFVREARMLSQLEHPNICKIYDFIEGEDTDYLVLELIDGQDLADLLNSGIEPALKMEIAIRVAAVLEVAHAKGVVHRDLKPDNIMLTTEGVTKVLDFGLARPQERTDPEESAAELAAPTESIELGDDGETLSMSSPISPENGEQTELLPGPDSPPPNAIYTRHGQLVGTPVYMSPEQARGEPVTTASDMYSFGLVLQTLFMEKLPYPRGLRSAEILARAAKGESLSVSGITADLAVLINRLKSMAPAARPTAVAALERLRWIRAKPKRRMRRLLAVALVVAIALGVAKYTIDLKAARDRADLRRSQAEDLIGFMIGDLRGKLAPVNSLEVLDDIGDKALAYFSAVPGEELSGDELLFRSQSLSQIGQVRMDQGDLPAAMEAFLEAERLTADLVERDPDNTLWRAELGAAHFWVGSVLWMQTDLDGALQSFRRYLDESQALVEREPENLDWQLELSYAQSNVGSVLEAKGDAAGAVEAFRTALETAERLTVTRPDNVDWQVELASSYSWLGEALLAGGDLGGALENYLANREILAGLVRDDPANRRYRWLLGIAHGKVGLLYELQARSELAAQELQIYVDLNRQLVRDDPDNLTWQRELAVALRLRGGLTGSVGDLDEAVSELGSAYTILLKLIEHDPSNTDWVGEQVPTLTGTATVLAAQNSIDEAWARASEAQILCQSLLADSAEDADSRLNCSRVYLTLGVLASKRGRDEAASGWWSTALETIEGLAQGSVNPFYRETWATALLRLDRLEEAGPIVAQLKAEGLRRPAFVELSRDKGVWLE